MSAACDPCLRRSHLVAHLAPGIAGLLDRPESRAAGLLALAEDELVAAAGGSRQDEAHRFLGRFDAGAARRRLEERAVDAVCAHDERYPDGLRDLADPPAAVFFTGGIDRLAALSAESPVALVGSRRASPYGLEVAHGLGRGLGAAGLTVVSGLALGIDAACHRGALTAAGGAVAVLAGGPDVPYPRRHRRLYERIRASGTILSELPPGQRPFRWSFPARNRLMAALARMVVVVEAGQPSGSLITAAFATQLGRVVGAVPGRVTARVAEGTNALLADGARLVSGPGDVLEELFGVGAAARMAPPGPPPPALAPAERRVLDAVEGGEDVAALGCSTGLPAREVRAALARLEASGHVRRVRLGAYERAVEG